MALIGTISGSNGTSTTAISGSVIIADRPPGEFPSLPVNAKFYVSGTRDVNGPLGAIAIFGGDIFVTGGLGVSDYVQMLSVNELRIPTNTSASYIYTSGSTNDMYFTQYTGPYTNTTRLRWLESVLSTGLLHGGIVSTQTGTTTFSITSGSGIIVSQNASTSSDPYPTIKFVQWPAYISQSLQYSGSTQLTYIAIDSNGQINQSPTAFNALQFKDRIVVGRILHQSGSVTNGAVNVPTTAYAVSQNTNDFVRAVGPLKLSGHVLSASGSTLSIIKTGGSSYVEGRNYSGDPNNPNIVSSDDDTAVTISKIYRSYVSGSTSITDTGVANAGYTVVNPGLYNNNGTLASVGNSEFSVQRVFWFPKAINKAFYVYYGSSKYATMNEAIDAVSTEAFTEGENTAGSAILVGYLCLRGNATTLTDTNMARIFQGGLFRGSSGATIGSATGGGLPGGLNTYVQFNDSNTFGGDSGFTYNKSTRSITLTGDVNAVSASLSGDLIVTNGSIELKNNDSSAADIKLYEPSNSGSNYISIRSPVLSTDLNLTLPDSYGNSGNVLSTDGSGILSWITASNGAQGAQGAQGAIGAQGVVGAQGSTGAQGAQGSIGSTGAQGAQGTQGAEGPQGFQGAAGTNGTQGTSGPQGYQGDQGPQGYQGDQGPQGYQGDQGPQGYQGDMGPQGNIGSQGSTGAQGPIGPAVELFFTANAGSMYTTGSVAFKGGESGVDDPNDKGTDVFFYVSGAIDSSGGAVRGTALFGGDLYASGALETSRYLRLSPTILPQLPQDNSSYIYTSGSTNDLYFAQYNAPYQNNVRLRWLEGGLNTGLLHGGVLSTETGTTTFSITSGSGIIVSYNASLNVEPFPVVQFLDWPSYTSQSLTYSGSAQITYIGVNQSGGLIQQTTPFQVTDYQNYIQIGRILHQSGSVTNGSITSPSVAYGLNQWNEAFNRAIGPLKISGHVLASSGSTLGLIKTGGSAYVAGKNYTYDPNNPNVTSLDSDPDVTISKIYREYVSGSTPVIDSGILNAGYTVIDPDQYSPSGSLSSVATDKFTVQRAFWFPNSVSRAVYVYYGVKEYDSIDLAQSGISSEIFAEGSNTIDTAILVAYIIVKKGATDLSNVSQAKIIQASTFRGIGASGGGAGGGGSTNPGGIDTYVQFNDGGSSFGGDSGFTYNKTTDTLSITNISSTKGTFISLTGSLTKLNTGDDYLKAGTNISIVTGSDGSVTVSSNTVGSTYDLASSVVGRPASSEILMKIILGHGATISSGYAYCEISPTSGVSLNIQKGIVSGSSINYVSEGDIQFDAGETIGIVTINSGTLSFSAGNAVRVVAPVGQDSTFSSPTITFVGLQTV